MNDLDSLLERLAKSNFRNRFHLKDKDREYVLEKGIDEIMDHAYNFVDTRLGVLRENDGNANERSSCFYRTTCNSDLL